MVTRRHAKKRSNRFGLYALVLLIVVLGLGSTGGAVAKYVQEHQGNGSLAAKEFYFTSNLLTDKGANYTLNSGITSVSFTLGNNADDLRFADDDIAYAIEVSLENGDDLGEGEGVLSKTAGTLNGGVKSVETFTLSGLVAGKTYEVTATGTAGYKEILNADFTVSMPGRNVYKYIDTSAPGVVVLHVWTENVWTEDVDGGLFVKFPERLIPDSTDPVLIEVDNYTDGEYRSGSFTDSSSFDIPYSSRKYRFFDDGATLSDDPFPVTLKVSETESRLASLSTPL